VTQFTFKRGKHARVVYVGVFLDRFEPQRGDTTMRKFIVAALAAASLLAAASAANAGYFRWDGVYIPTCVYNLYGYYCW
jgi:hypothetical protein